VLSAYYRIRLQKIQQYVLHYCQIIEKGNVVGLMSDSEIKFAKNYFQIWKKYMTDNVTRHLPSQFQSLVYRTNLSPSVSTDIIPRPDVDCHVIFCALSDIGDIIDREEEAELIGIEKGSRWSIRYTLIKPYLLERKVELI